MSNDYTDALDAITGAIGTDVNLPLSRVDFLEYASQLRDVLLSMENPAPVPGTVQVSEEMWILVRKLVNAADKRYLGNEIHDLVKELKELGV